VITSPSWSDDRRVESESSARAKGASALPRE
jgi:hypothetical protein